MHSSIYFNNKDSSKEYQITEKDMSLLFDNSIWSEKSLKERIFFTHDCIVLSHEKYIYHQQEFERISKIPGIETDSLMIWMDYFDDKTGERKYFHLNTVTQFKEYMLLNQKIYGLKEPYKLEDYFRSY